jgi:hypothetical protein
MAVSSYQPQLSQVFMGLAADTKPPTAPPGSKFLTTDTLLVFIMLNTGVWTQIGTVASATGVPVTI